MLAGAVLLVASKDKVLSLESVGYADIETKRPMPTNALCGIASMSKPIAATAVMMLVDEGKVSLDDPVEKYLPEFKGLMVVCEKDDDHVLLKKPKQVLQIRHLLTHTSGILYRSPVQEPTLDGLPLRVAVRSYAMMPLQFEPGSKYLYSNGGINTAACIVEVVSGMPYEKFLDERLFKPLGMRDTTFWPSEQQAKRLCTFYKANAENNGLVPMLSDRLTYPLTDRIKRHPIPAIGLFSTARDMVKFCQLFLNGGVYEGKRYLSEAAVKQMTSKQTAEDQFNYGFGWATGAEGTFSHAGSFRTFMTVYPKPDVITLLMAQGWGEWPGEEGKKILPTFDAAAAKLAAALRK